MGNKILKILIIACCNSYSTHAQNLFRAYEELFTKPLQYTCFQTDERMTMDGKMNEVSWNKAKWSEYFTDIEGSKKPTPKFSTRFKLLWDKNYLYVAAELTDPDLWAVMNERDQLLFMENNFEIFIDPDNDSHNYFEYEINPLKTVFDLFLSMPYRNKGKMGKDWDIKDLKKGVQLDGSLNDPSDRDKKWTVEFAIPFVELKYDQYVSPAPADKSLWRINFLRVQWDLDTVNRKYQKKMNAGKPMPEHFWSWSPQGIINMHYPERYGYLQFSTKKAGTAIEESGLPFSEELKKYLWLIYYKQADYFTKNGSYASSLAAIEYPDSGILLKSKNAVVRLHSTGTAFSATIEYDQEKWQIDHTGLIFKLQ
jgi:hypothetical protein